MINKEDLKVDDTYVNKLYNLYGHVIGAIILDDFDKKYSDKHPIPTSDIYSYAKYSVQKRKVLDKYLIKRYPIFRY